MNQIMPRAAVFDFDGVLVNSEVIALEELQNCLREVGISADKEDMTSTFLGSSFEDIAEYVRRINGYINAEEFRDTWYKRLFKRYEEELTVMKGALALINILDKRGLSYCIASGGSYQRLNFALHLTGLDDIFNNRAFSVDSVAKGKPEPDIFLFAAERLSIPAEQCLVVEDATAGVVAARRAGMPVIGYVGGDHLNDCRKTHTVKLTDAGAIAVIDDLLEVPDFMKPHCVSRKKRP